VLGAQRGRRFNTRLITPIVSVNFTHRMNWSEAFRLAQHFDR
jgi:hypothetical protein